MSDKILYLAVHFAALSAPPPDTKQLPPVDAPASPAQKMPVPLPKELLFLVPEQSASAQTKRPVSTAVDSSTVISYPVCRIPIVEECGKKISRLRRPLYTVFHIQLRHHMPKSCYKNNAVSRLYGLFCCKYMFTCSKYLTYLDRFCIDFVYIFRYILNIFLDILLDIWYIFCLYFNVY